MSKIYPESLPLGLHNGRTYQLESPLQRTALSSGRARQRRRFTSVPQYADISWFFNSIQAAAFETWWRDALVDGALWFLCPLKTVIGVSSFECRFTGVYSGPSLAGPDLWGIQAQLEIRERVVSAYPPGWGEFPNLILGSSIIDFAINEKWPEFTFDYVSYAAAIADIRNLRNGVQINIKTDETQGGRHSVYSVVRAEQPSLNLDFINQVYRVGIGSDSLSLVVTYAA